MPKGLLRHEESKFSGHGFFDMSAQALMKTPKPKGTPLDRTHEQFIKFMAARTFCSADGLLFKDAAELERQEAVAARYYKEGSSGAGVLRSSDGVGVPRRL